MAATEKLYLNDATLMDFEAAVTAVGRFDGKPSLCLDRSAFYGEAGGQLGDRGVLAGAAGQCTVIDCQYDGETLHHILAEPIDDSWLGATVKGKVDFAFRRDMMSQHTGQHLLSAVLFHETGAETLSARLGAERSTVDIDKKLSQAQVAKVSEVVNDLVMSARAVRPLYPTAEELDAMPLRRKPKVSKDIRILEIEGYDLTPCGGTHCTNTGEIGAVYVTSTEGYKGGQRLNFVCGARTLAYLAEKHQTLNDLGDTLGCGAAGIGESLQAMRRELKERAEESGKLRAELNHILAQQLLVDNPATDEGVRLRVIRDDGDLKSLRGLASALTKRSDVAVLVAGRDGEDQDWRVIVARGADSDLDAGAWFRGPGKALGARGGGRPNHAEGRISGEVAADQIVL